MFEPRLSIFCLERIILCFFLLTSKYFLLRVRQKDKVLISSQKRQEELSLCFVAE